MSSRPSSSSWGRDEKNKNEGPAGDGNRGADTSAIDPASTCATAQIKGYDVAGGLTVNQWRSNSAYHYTLKPGAPDIGRASEKVNTNGCNSGQTIKVQIYIPDDTEAGVVPGRFPAKLAALQKFQINAIPVHDSWVATATDVPSIRYNLTAVWTGTEMIVWGGCTDSLYFNTGGRYVT